MTIAEEKSSNLGIDTDERELLENLVVTYVEASRYLATCGEFNEEKSCKLQEILSKHPWYNADQRGHCNTKYNIPMIMFTETGLNGCDNNKTIQYRVIAYSLAAFLNTLMNHFPDDRTQQLINKCVKEMEYINELISIAKDI